MSTKLYILEFREGTSQMVVKRWKWKALIVGLISLSMLAAGCSTNKGSTSTDSQQSSGKLVKITYGTFEYGTNNGAAWTTAMLAAFNEKYKGKIEVDVTEMPPTDSYIDNVKTLLASNAMPDVFRNQGINLISLGAADSGKLVDLTPYLNANPDAKAVYDMNDLMSTVNSKNGKIYGMPMTKMVVGYFYNKDIFKQAGIDAPATSWDEFWQDLDKIKAAGFTPIALSTGSWWNEMLLDPLIGTNGEAGNKFMNTDHPTDYNTPEVLSAVTSLQKILTQYTNKSELTSDSTIAIQNFYNGKDAIFANGPWQIPEMQDPSKSGAGFIDKVGVAAFPGPGVFSGSDNGDYMLAKTKETQDAAWTFMQFAHSIEWQQKYMEMTGATAASPKVQFSDKLKQDNPLFVSLIEQANAAKYKFNVGDNLWFPNVVASLDTNIPLLAQNKMTPQQFVDAMTNAAKQN